MLHRISVVHRVSVELGIEHFQHVGQRQVLSPIRLPTNRPRYALVLDHHLQDIGGQCPIAGRQRIADRSDDINVTGTQPMNGPRDTGAPGTGSRWITKEWLVRRNRSLHFLYRQTTYKMEINKARVSIQHTHARLVGIRLKFKLTRNL